MLSDDYFSVEPEAIKGIESVLTIVGGKIVFGADEYGPLGPGALPVSPEWSPLTKFGGYHRATAPHNHAAPAVAEGHVHKVLSDQGNWNLGCLCYA